MEEQKEQQLQGAPQGQKFHLDKKILIILGSIATVLLFVIAIVLTQGDSGGGNPLANPSVTPGQNAINPSQNPTRKNNPLINPVEIDKVESALRKKMETSGISISPKPKYKFEYQLDPGLQGGKSSSLFIKSVFAANTCNIQSAPSMVNVYTLKTHMNIVDAKKVAAEYDITGEPSGIPSIDGTSYEYYFADAVVSQFLKLSEPSALSYWHRVVESGISVDIGATQAKAIAKQELEKHNLLNNAVLKKSEVDPANGSYISYYEKNYDNLIMTDTTFISALGASKPVCSIEPTRFMNYIEAIVTKNGYIQKIINKTRGVKQSYLLKRATLDESVQEYKNNPPIDPIVIGGNANNGNVTIDEAVLVWYEYGELFPQTAYIPMYLTSGKTTTGVRVLTLFPAVSMAELNKTPIPDLSGSRNVLQLYTFNPQPVNDPPAPAAPLTGTPYPTVPGMPPLLPGITGLPGLPPGLLPSGFPVPAPGGGIGACWGKLVDYNVYCTDSVARVVCNTIVSAPIGEDGKNDPWGVCKNGCQTKSETIDIPADQNPCNEYLKKNNIEIDKSYHYNDYKGGPVVCKAQGCPC